MTGNSQSIPPNAGVRPTRIQTPVGSRTLTANTLISTDVLRADNGLRGQLERGAAKRITY